MRSSIRKICALTLMALVAYLVIDEYKTAVENSRHLNPRIFPAFRHIENVVMAKAVRPREYTLTDRELYVLEHSIPASDPIMNPSAEAYYRALQQQGFRLPPLYTSGYLPQDPLWHFWK